MPTLTPKPPWMARQHWTLAGPRSMWTWTRGFTWWGLGTGYDVYTQNVWERIHSRCGMSGLEILADCTGLFASKRAPTVFCFQPRNQRPNKRANPTFKGVGAGTSKRSSINWLFARECLMSPERAGR